MSTERRGHALKTLPDVICPECGEPFRPQGIGRHRKHKHPDTYEPTANGLAARARIARTGRGTNSPPDSVEG